MDKPKFHRIRKIADIATNHPIPLQYWVEGILLDSPRIGDKVIMLRLANTKNPEGKLGYFQTSKIVSIDQNKITTANSVYEIEEIKEEDLSCQS